MPPPLSKDSIPVILAAMLTGGGVSIGWNYGNDPRPFPFTSIDAKEMRLKLEARIHEIEVAHIKLMLDLGRESRSTNKVQQLEFRMQLLEEDMETVKK